MPLVTYLSEANISAIKNSIESDDELCDLLRAVNNLTGNRVVVERSARVVCGFFKAKEKVSYRLYFFIGGDEYQMFNFGPSYYPVPVDSIQMCYDVDRRAVSAWLFGYLSGHHRSLGDNGGDCRDE